MHEDVGKPTVRKYWECRKWLWL